MNLSFERFDREKDLAEQRKLFSDAFPENNGLPPSTVAFYRRKFTMCPANPSSFEFIARDDDGLVGYYAALPFRYTVGDEILRCGMVCDVMTSPRVRGRGVFTQLGRYSLAELTNLGIDFVSGYPRRSEVLPGHTKVGWSVNFELPMFVHPLRLDGLLRSRKLGFFSPLANLSILGVRSARSMFHRKRAGYSVQVLPWRQYLERFDHDAFWREWQLGQRIALVKDSTFLRWRLSIQEAEYHVVVVECSSKVMGISIARRCDPEGVPSIAILDVMCLNLEHLAPFLFSGWMNIARTYKAELLLTMMSPRYSQALRLPSLGFYKSPVVFKLITKALSERAIRCFDPSEGNWQPMWIDSDDL